MDDINNTDKMVLYDFTKVIFRIEGLSLFYFTNGVTSYQFRLLNILICCPHGK